MTNPNDDLKRIKQVEERYKAKPLLWRLRNWVACPNPLETAHEAADEITHLRGNLSLAEEGLASAMQESQRLPEILNCPRLTVEAPAEQVKAVLRDVDKGLPVNGQDLINALWWRVRNQQREIAGLHKQRRSFEPPEQHPAIALLKEADYWLDELRHKGNVVGPLQDRIHAITAPEDDSHNGVLVKRGSPWPPTAKSGEQHAITCPHHPYQERKKVMDCTCGLAQRT